MPPSDRRSTNNNNNNSKSTNEGNKIHTLASIDPLSSTNTRKRPSFSFSLSSSLLQTQELPNLPHSNDARSLLFRIRTEFLPIVERRGYNVTTVTEMCCCGDGIDHQRSHGPLWTTATTAKRRKGKKTRTMPDNVLGYNLTRGRTHHIHLRLRCPRTHELFGYEEVAGTMCHELAHCERGPHDATFYRIMEEIIEQHAVFVAKGIVAGTDGFPTANSAQAHILGGGSSSSRSSSGSSSRRDWGTKKNDASASGNAAEERRRKGRMGLGGSFVLGSTSNDGATMVVGKGKGSRKALLLPPGEAARIAAERRLEEWKIRDEKFCLPCNEVIEILEGDSDEEEENGVGGTRNEVNQTKDGATKTIQEKRKARKDINKKRSQAIERETIIDLTNEETKDDYVRDDMRVIDVNTTSPDSRSGRSEWTCSQCTYLNQNPLSLVCDVCLSERENNTQQPLSTTSLPRSADPSSINSDEGTAKETIRQDIVRSVQANEVARSEAEFGGFNIYGDSSRRKTVRRFMNRSSRE